MSGIRGECRNDEADFLPFKGHSNLPSFLPLFLLPLYHDVLDR